MRAFSVTITLAMLGGLAAAQGQAPAAMPPHPSLAQSAAMRFPQPVRAGDLLGRDVLQPVESQTVLGTVRSIVRGEDGAVQVVMSFGGVLGVGRRLIAVPLDATALLGQDVEVVAFTPEQLRHFPDFTPAGAVPVPPDTVLKVGLAKPSH